MRITQTVYASFKTGQCTIAVFLDVQSAFDKVWTEGVYFKLLKSGLPPYLIHIAANFLRNRTLLVKQGECFSDGIKMNAGTPQGTVLSLILFNFFIDKILKDLSHHIHASQFADDVGIWCCGTDPKEVAKKLQLALNDIQAWCQKWRVKMSPAKSQMIMFSR